MTLTGEINVTSLWFDNSITLEAINASSLNTLVSHLGIIFTKISENSLEATMPADERTFQPARILHGGASCVLSETLGSVAANLTQDPKDKMCVGQHIEATHLRAVRFGIVRGVATNLYKGRTTQTWRIEIYNEDGKMTCDSKIIMAIVNKK